VKLNGARIAVTGATGFLGGHLIEALRSRGAHAIAVVRNHDKAAPLAAQGVEIREADLDAPAALERAFCGIDAVVHNAAVVSFTKPRETMHTNAEGTRNVFEALARAGVKRSVAISSTTVYPWSLHTLSEAAPLRKGNASARLSAYGESKARAEHIAWDISQRNGVALTTLRPCGITGPGDSLLIPALRAATRGAVAVLPVFTIIGVVHAADVAEVVCKALERDISQGKAYNLQGHTVSLWKLARLWAHLRGHPPKVCVPLIAPFALRYDDSRARRELDFRPRSLEAIFREAQA
jgi:nucleoside-diphosphate-sugar epimerase